MLEGSRAREGQAVWEPEGKNREQPWPWLSHLSYGSRLLIGMNAL